MIDKFAAGINASPSTMWEIGAAAAGAPIGTSQSDRDGTGRSGGLRHRSEALPKASGFTFIGKPRDKRKAYRKKVAVNAWIRLNGFAVRPCKVIDLSDSGVQIEIGAGQNLPNTFTLMLSRDTGSGRRARVIWRRGSQIGAEFI